MNIPSELVPEVGQAPLTTSLGIQSSLSKLLLGASLWSDHGDARRRCPFVVGFASAKERKVWTPSVDR